MHIAADQRKRKRNSSPRIEIVIESFELDICFWQPSLGGGEVPPPLEGI